MGIPQWQRAEFIVKQFIAADSAGRSMEECRGEIKEATEKKFNWCHDCLLLAVYGFYKNGIIENTPRSTVSDIDFTGFNGKDSEDIRHAFDALSLLEKDDSLRASHLKKRLGGEQSIYSFVVHYFNRGLLRQPT